MPAAVWSFYECICIELPASALRVSQLSMHTLFSAILGCKFIFWEGSCFFLPRHDQEARPPQLQSSSRIPVLCTGLNKPLVFLFRVRFGLVWLGFVYLFWLKTFIQKFGSKTCPAKKCHGIDVPSHNQNFHFLAFSKWTDQSSVENWVGIYLSEVWHNWGWVILPGYLTWLGSNASGERSEKDMSLGKSRT